MRTENLIVKVRVRIFSTVCSIGFQVGSYIPKNASAHNFQKHIQDQR